MSSIEAWWELVPRLAGPLATAMANMEPDVLKQIRERAFAAATAAARPTDDGMIELGGSIVVTSGGRPASEHQPV